MEATPKETEPVPQPQAITIEEYRRRIARKKETQATRIPPTQKPKHRRAGKQVQLRRRLAELLNKVKSENPPPWEVASELWLETDSVREELNGPKRGKRSED